MATSPEYIEYVLDLLTAHYRVSARKMFGGVGIFCEYGMCALISSDDTLYFKVDDQNRDDYTNAGMPQFMNMPYFQVPADLLEDSESLGTWLAKSIAAAKRTAGQKK